MQRILAFFFQRAVTLFFPVALILYDFAAYLSTDLIQPGIVNVARDFNADAGLALAAVSPYLTGDMALQWLLGPLSNRIGRRPVLIAGVLIFTLACAATLFITSMTQFLVARFVQGTSICFIATVGYVAVQKAFGQTKAIKLMAIITSIVLVVPVIGPLPGVVLTHFVHWKILFAIIAVMGLIALIGLTLAMSETIQRGAVPFSTHGVVRDFCDVSHNRVFLFGAAMLSLSYTLMMSWVAVSPVILIGADDMTTSELAWVQAPIFGVVIVANTVVVRFVKDPTRLHFIRRAAPMQSSELAVLIVGNLLWPYVWLWSVPGTSLYAFGIGTISPTLFRFALFSNNLSKGTVSTSLNTVILTVMATFVEIGRWLRSSGGRISFYPLAVAARIAVVFTLAGLLKRVRQYEATTLAIES